MSNLLRYSHPVERNKKEADVTPGFTSKLSEQRHVVSAAAVNLPLCLLRRPSTLPFMLAVRVKTLAQGVIF